MQHYLKLSPETLYLGISLLDTILDKRDVEADKLQLVGCHASIKHFSKCSLIVLLFKTLTSKVGIASLYVASKCEEYYPADLKKLVHLTENSYRVQDV